jgi:hypothetical protein
MDLTEVQQWRICVEATFVYDLDKQRFKYGKLKELSDYFGRTERTIQLSKVPESATK